jgi:preprotein translocase subunit YajC
MLRLINFILALVKMAAEAVALFAFAVLFLFVLFVSFLWFLTPWQQRKIQEKYRRQRAAEAGNEP